VKKGKNNPTNVKGSTVKVRRRPAAVTGDKHQRKPLLIRVGRTGK